MDDYIFEGQLFRELCREGGLTADRLSAARDNGETVEAVAGRLDAEGRLWVPLGDINGFIPANESGIGEIKRAALISLVGKPVCFKVRELDCCSRRAVLSRKDAQAEFYESRLACRVAGDIIDGQIKSIRPFGCFVDIGRGITALLPTASICVSRLSSPQELFSVGDRICCVIAQRDGERILLSHRELLGTFEQNAAAFSGGETVIGTVRSCESYGVFVELSPNLTGLAEPFEGAARGDAVSVYIKSINRKTMKVKLAILETVKKMREKPEIRYFFAENHIDRFLYSPKNCEKVIETVFNSESVV